MDRAQQRILDRCKQNADGCWIWIGCRNSKGYGLMYFESDCLSGMSMTTAHRMSYLAFKGQIGDGLVVRHTCHVPLCVNPDHLRIGTQQDNIDDMMKAGRWRGSASPGAKNGNAKLTELQVAEIRSRYKKQNRNSVKTGPTLKELAAEFGLGISQIARIVKGESWQ